MRSCAFSFARQGRMTVNSATAAVASRIRPAAKPAIFRRSGKRRIGVPSIGPRGGSWQVFGLTCQGLFVKVRRPMPQDPPTLDDELVASVRIHTERVDEAEIRAALAPLSRSEQEKLERLLRNAQTVKLGPFGWADVARGTPVEVAAAREVSGYYALLAERDALAALVPPEELRRRKRAAASERAQHLLGLFAYHRHAPLV